jgi:hypothetical protein
VRFIESRIVFLRRSIWPRGATSARLGSASSNIAEGSGRNSDRDFAHFLENSHGSPMEVAPQLFLAFDEEYVDEAMLNAILENARVLSAKIAALNRSLLVKVSKVVLRPPSTLDPRPSTRQ